MGSRLKARYPAVHCKLRGRVLPAPVSGKRFYNFRT